MNARLSNLSPEQIRNKLALRDHGPYIFPNPEILVPGPTRPAAVLVPMIRKASGWELLFIRRTQVDGDPHSGQVAFPGGRMDPADKSPAATAIREANEEIGLGVEDIEILGDLEYMVTISNYKLTPIVALIRNWPLPLARQEAEVDRIFPIPLNWLAEKINLREEMRDLPQANLNIPVYYFNEFDGELLWGVTAHIVVNLVDALSS